MIHWLSSVTRASVLSHVVSQWHFNCGKTLFYYSSLDWLRLYTEYFLVDLDATLEFSELNSAQAVESIEFVMKYLSNFHFQNN